MPPEQLVARSSTTPRRGRRCPAEPDVDFILAEYRDLTALARYAWTPFLCNPEARTAAAPDHLADARRLAGRRPGRSRVAHGRRYAELIPDARFAVIGDCGHAHVLRAPRGVRRPGGRLPGDTAEGSQPVKFYFFHLMPYPYLPADFDEKYDSPSLTFPNGHFDPKLGTELYHALPRRARVRRRARLRRHRRQRAPPDRLRADAVAEHHGRGAGPADRARQDHGARQRDRRIRGNPLRVAEEIAMLDSPQRRPPDLRLRPRDRLGVLRPQHQPDHARAARSTRPTT